MLSFNVSPANRGGGAGGGQANANLASAPLERIVAIISEKGIVGVQVPFQTPRAQSVRQFIHARLLNESNQKMFIWRRDMNNMWTNVSLNSTPESPQLTAPPMTCVTALTTILPTCPDVSEVQLYDESNNRLTYEDVQSMVFQDPSSSAIVPAATNLPPLPPVSAETVAEKLNQVANKLDELAIVTKTDMVQFQTNVEKKLEFILDVLGGNPRTTYDLGRRSSAESGSSTNDDEVKEGEAADQATPKRPSRAISKAEGKKKQKA